MTVETLAAAWESITRGLYQPLPDAKLRSTLRAWLQGIAWRRANTFFGRTYQRREVSVEQVPEDSAASTEGALLARDELSLLDGIAPERRAVLLAHASWCGVGEIAEVMGVCENTVWSRLRQGRLDLLAAMRREAAKTR